MLANGDISAQYGVLAGGFAGTDQTVELMRKMSQGKFGSRSPKIRALAINIVNSAGIPEKDEYREMVAIHNWVRDTIRYQKDVHGQETLSHPEETAFNSGAEDCDGKAMLEAALLSSIGIPTRFKTIGTSPMQYSHVYLEASPRGKGWIPLDPIMKNKPAGWEVPKSRQKLVKVYSENRPSSGDAMNGMNGMDGMDGMGHVSEYDGSSFLGARSQGKSPYVRMQSFLDSDLPIEQISQQLPANPANQNIPQKFPRQRMLAQRRDPILQRPAGRMGGRLPEASMDAVEAEAMQPGNGVDGVYGPDALAGLGTLSAVEGVFGVGSSNGKSGSEVVSMPKQSTASPYMQSKTVSHSPEGVDDMFTRPNMIYDKNKGDLIDYFGHKDLSERPPIYPVGVSGYASGAEPLPGMGASDVAPATPSNALKMVGIGLLLFGAYKYATKRA